MNKKHPGTVLSDAVFDGMAEYAEKHSGFAGDLATEMTLLSRPKRTWSRQHVNVFYSRKGRHEPRYGTGLLALAAWANIKRRKEQAMEEAPE